MSTPPVAESCPHCGGQLDVDLRHCQSPTGPWLRCPSCRQAVRSVR